MDTNKLTEVEKAILRELIASEIGKLGIDIERVERLNGYAETEASKWRSSLIFILDNLKLKLQPTDSKSIDLEEFMKIASPEIIEKFHSDYCNYGGGDVSSDDYFLANCKYWMELLNNQK